MAITRTQIAKQLLAQGGRTGFQGGGMTMGEVADSKGNVGPVGGGAVKGPVDKSTLEQTMNTRKAILDAGGTQTDKLDTLINTVGDATLLKNIINLNPQGVIKNIGTKLILDKLTKVPDSDEDSSSMQLAGLTEKQKELLDQRKGMRDTLGDDFLLDTIKQDDDPNDPATLEDVQTYLGADGGRVAAMNGGIMGGLADGNFDFENARQMYGLGKLVKKVTRSVKKIAKSPIGKAALLYIGTGGLGNLAAGKSFFGGSFANVFKPTQFLSNVGSIFTKPGFENIMAKAKLGSFQPQGGGDLPMFEKNFLGKALTSPSGIITATSAIAGMLTAEQEEEAQNIADETGIDIETIRANPNQYLGRRFRAEGGSMKEPVAKKTMPLLDMDGQEMDLRAEGGFVPIGRMEKADDVPARLSKNEFVFTADAVRNAGDGDVDKGAEVMYNMMKNLESGGEVSEESQGLEGARKMFQTSQRLEEVL